MHYDELEDVSDAPTDQAISQCSTGVPEGVVFSPLPVTLTKSTMAAYYS